MTKCASLTEDQYGVVQRDIPKILEAMVRFRRAVEKWRAEISAVSSCPALAANVSPSNSTTTATTADSPPRPANDSKSKQEQQEEERAKANAILTELSDGLKESIGRIVRTFGNKLMAFKFPPAVASGVQGFMDYC